MAELPTRRQVLALGLKAGGGLIALGAAGYVGYRWPRPAPTAPTQPANEVLSYVSRPDLKPPRVDLFVARGRRPAAEPRQVVLAPRGYALGAPGQQGVLVFGVDGHPVWFQPTAGVPMDARVQTYEGRPVLTWWEGAIENGYGSGKGVIVDATYREVATVRAGNGLDADLHEFLLTPQGTALITVYSSVQSNLSSVGGPRSGAVLDSVVQEVEVASGRVLFEWHSLDHVGLEESYAPPPGPAAAAPLDYFHINSIEVAPDGDLLLSARNTWAVYKVSRKTGEIAWRLNGKRTDFAMGPGAAFYWQHDARALAGGAISIFDDGATPPKEEQSRGIVLGLDTAAMKATLEHQFTHPARLLAPNQGSMQVLDDGGAFVGWGAEPYFSEFDRAGTLVMDGRLPNNVQSYRTYLQSWTGNPTDQPAVAVRASAVGGSTVYASWNGASELSTWQVLAGPDSGSLKAVARSHRAGFETVISVASTGPYFAVVGLDRTGKELGQSAVVKA